VDPVQYIIETVVDQLSDNPDRRFIQVEQGFFYRWWERQHEPMRDKVRKLVASGRLEFINGGWVMHDEACAHYTDMVHQMAMGHRFLMATFNVTPRIAWQIDPFGHSATQASLITAQAGLEAVFMGRVDQQEKESRLAAKTMEFVWRADGATQRENQVLGMVSYDGYYSPSQFRYQDSDDPSYRIQDNPYGGSPNVQRLVDEFVAEVTKRAEGFKTNHLLFPMGEDFAFDRAILWFKNMDKLIHYVNLDGRVNALYSTPSMYLDALHSANATWPLKTGDMFPYQDDGPYWSGYFSSRPSLKLLARSCSALLLATTAAEAAVGKEALQAWGMATGRMMVLEHLVLDTHMGKTTRDSQKEEKQADGGESAGGVERMRVGWESERRVRVASSFRLEEAVAVVQHHDGITGTAQQHVTDDYSDRLHRASEEEAVAVVQHHDGITGTAQQHVTDDYSDRLHRASEEVRVARIEVDPFSARVETAPVSVWHGLEEAVAVVQHHDGITGTAQQHVTDDYSALLHRIAEEVRDECMGREESAVLTPHHARHHPPSPGTSHTPPSPSVPPPANFPSHLPTSHAPPYQPPMQASAVLTAALAHLITRGTLPPSPSVPPSNLSSNLSSRAAAAVEFTFREDSVEQRGWGFWNQLADGAEEEDEEDEEDEGDEEGKARNKIDRMNELLYEADRAGAAADDEDEGDEEAGEGDVPSAQHLLLPSNRNTPAARSDPVPYAPLVSMLPPSHPYPYTRAPLRIPKAPLRTPKAPLRIPKAPLRTPKVPLGIPKAPHPYHIGPHVSTFLIHPYPSGHPTGGGGLQPSYEVVVAFNPLAWSRSEVIRFPVSSPYLLVTDASGAPIPSQKLQETLLSPPSVPPVSPPLPLLSLTGRRSSPPPPRSTYIAAYTGVGEIVGEVEGEEEGVEGGEGGEEGAEEGEEGDEEEGGGGGGRRRSGGAAGAGTDGGERAALRVSFSKSAVGMQRMELVSRSANGTEEVVRMGMAVSASMMEYATFAGGAYIFQPSKPAMPITSTNATYQVPIHIQRGPIVEEFSRQITPWISEVSALPSPPSPPPP
ncbi:unnamed protein product, partial [Closterium sp. NIES-65]